MHYRGPYLVTLSIALGILTQLWELNVVFVIVAILVGMLGFVITARDAA